LTIFVANINLKNDLLPNAGKVGKKNFIELTEHQRGIVQSATENKVLRNNILSGSSFINFHVGCPISPIREPEAWQ